MLIILLRLDGRCILYFSNISIKYADENSVWGDSGPHDDEKHTEVELCYTGWGFPLSDKPKAQHD